MELYLIRHGLTRGNEERRYIGRTDEPLSERGRRQLAEGINYPPVQVLFTSPMARCRESCGQLYPGMEALEVPDFAEIDFGDFEGKNYQELSSDDRYQAWIDSGGAAPFPGGESREDFVRRTLRGYEKMLDRIRELAPEGAGLGSLRAAAVVHGGTIMAILSAYYGGDYFDYQIGNGEGYLVQVTPGQNGNRITWVEKLSADDKGERRA